MTSAQIDAGVADPDVILASQGDREAFGRIYARCQSTVFRFAFFRCRNRQLAEDITSATFLRALSRVENFAWQGKDIGAWFITIARNLMADHYKSGRHRYEELAAAAEHALNDDHSEMLWRANKCVSAEDIVFAMLNTRYARRLVAALASEDQRRVIELRFFGELSVAETAVEMDRHEGAIKALQYRATRALLRIVIDEAGEQPASPGEPSPR